MRHLSLCSLILAVTAFVFAPTTFSAAGWCLQFHDNSGFAGTLCRFQTFEQCLASRNSFVDTCIVDLQSPPLRSSKPGNGMPTAKKR
jgi:hypothetical protein